MSKSESLPLVRVGAYVKDLGYHREQQDLVYSARVEYVMYRMPGEAMSSTVSGTARVYGDAADAGDRARLEDLRRSAIEAAIRSAMRRAPEAIAAASGVRE